MTIFSKVWNLTSLSLLLVCLTWVPLKAISLPYCFAPLCPTPLFSFPTQTISVPRWVRWTAPNLEWHKQADQLFRNQSGGKHQEDSKIQRKEITSGNWNEERQRILPRWSSVRVWTRKWQIYRSVRVKCQRPSARTMKTRLRNCKTGALYSGSYKLNNLSCGSLHFCVKWCLFCFLPRRL